MILVVQTLFRLEDTMLAHIGVWTETVGGSQVPVLVKGIENSC